MSYLFNKNAPGSFEKEGNIKGNKVYLSVRISPDFDCDEAADFGPGYITCYDDEGNSTFNMSTDDDEEYWPDDDFDENTFLNASSIEISFISNLYAEKAENDEIKTIDLTFVVNDKQICSSVLGNDKIKVSFEFD